MWAESRTKQGILAQRTKQASSQPTSRAMELVVGAMGSLIPKLIDLLKEEYKLKTGVKDEVRSLVLELDSAHAALCKVAEVRPDQLDELVKIWAHEVREASYDMEDILDTYFVRVVGSHNPDDKESLLKGLAEKIPRLFKKSKERHMIVGAIEKTKKNLQEVTERHGRYTVHNIIVANPEASSRTIDPRLTPMYKDASQFIGIDKSSADLISLMLPKGEDDSNQKMKIVTIVGVGGLGKTTLAMAVYDKLKSIFSYGAFVPVGQDPDLKKVFRDILIHLDKERYTDLRYTVWGFKQLIDELRVLLETKRYFVVIDDIWEPQSLDIIKSALIENNCGSRVIITTRKFEVAKEADEVYKLEPLSYDNSRKLFYTRLFGGEDKCPNNHPDEISDTILKKCGGIPLAIITMASVLLNKSREEWIEVSNSPSFHQDKNDRPMENTMHISWAVDPRLTAMYREASQIIGIDKSSADLISLMSPKGEDDSNQRVKIVSVVGVGGLGKTTLAKVVYDKLKSIFAYGAFVPVGQDPELKEVFRDILIHLDKEKYTDLKYMVLDIERLIDELRVLLKTKRYFFVIDDIWEPQALAAIMAALVENNCGSRVIITTRKFEVAKEADEVYKLEPLSYDNSRKLFYTRLFGGEDKCPNNHPHEISDTILKKCGGIPLAIITMASFLLGKSRKEWIEVSNSPGFYQDKNDRHMENTMHILSLSYYDLPSHLKACLLYLSLFPKDFLIHKDSLIWKWIAEGFVEKKPGRGLFEVGEEYFHDLINRSMIQGVGSEVYGIKDGCRIHDMVLDLILSKSHKENFVSDDDGTLSQSRARRLASRNRELDLTQNIHVNLPQVRSYIVLQCDIDKWALHPRLKFIRVLALDGCTSSEDYCLEYIRNLLHLRYLGIRDLWINKLPEAIGSLKFLQTLDLVRAYFRSPELPCSIGMLTQLVCLRALWLSAPDGVIRKLTSLEELQIGAYDMDNKSMIQFVKDLGNLCKLRVLKINNITGMDESTQMYLMESLGCLQKMQHLTLEAYFGFSADMNAWNAWVPFGDLRCLFLTDIMFPILPSWINFAHLPSLTHLELEIKGMDEQGLKALGSLPELCYLNLTTLSTATMTSSNNEAHVYFKKMKSWVSPVSTVQFVANDDLKASFTIFYFMDIGTSREKADCRVAVPATVVMPKLEELEFRVNVRQLMENNVTCENLGLEYLPSIRKVTVHLECRFAFEDDVEKQEAALRRTIQVHPNHPTLQIKDYDK